MYEHDTCRRRPVDFSVEKEGGEHPPHARIHKHTHTRAHNVRLWGVTPRDYGVQQWPRSALRALCPHKDLSVANGTRKSFHVGSSFDQTFA